MLIQLNDGIYESLVSKTLEEEQSSLFGKFLQSVYECENINIDNISSLKNLTLYDDNNVLLEQYIFLDTDICYFHEMFRENK